MYHLFLMLRCTLAIGTPSMAAHLTSFDVCARNNNAKRVLRDFSEIISWLKMVADLVGSNDDRVRF